MRRVLVAGCGYVGEAAADFFHERDWAVEGWTASEASAKRLTEKPYRVVAVDISSLATASPVDREFDVVMQCVSTRGGDSEAYRRIYLEGARTLLRLFPLAKHLFTSSTSVYGQQNGELVSEASPAIPIHEKGQVLREAEEIVLEKGGIVARVGAIYGPGRSFLLRSVLEGNSIVEQGSDRFLNQAHRGDIVTAFFLLAERRDDLGGEIFNVVDDEPMLASEAIQWLSSRLRQSLPSRSGGPRKRGTTNKRVSNRKLRDQGWELRFPNFREGMSRSVLESFGIE